jgi:hypothetical protein
VAGDPESWAHVRRELDERVRSRIARPAVADRVARAVLAAGDAPR